MNRKTLLLAGVLGFSLVSFSAAESRAGGANQTTNAGTPVLWQGTVTYNVETGPIKGDTAADGGTPSGSSGGGCELTKSLDVGNTQAVDIVRAAFDTWKNVPNSSIDIQEGPSLGTDVNFDNVEKFWVGSFFDNTVASEASAAGCYDSDPNTKCNNSIIFDSSNVPERSVVDAIQGRCARFSVLAFAAIVPQQDAAGNITSPILKSAQMVVSGACVPPVIAPDPTCATDGNPRWNETACPTGGITLEELQGTVTHEVGHFLGLDHTLTNKQNYIDCKTGAAGCVPENIPTMIGFFIPGANLNTLHYDDKVTFSRYYPSAGMAAATCTIKGAALSSVGSGSTSGRCLEVVAKKNNDPAFAASFIAGSEVARANNNGQQNNCTAGSAAACGAYEIRGLEPGNYTLSVQNFNDNGKGSALNGFILEPCHPAFDSTAFGDNPTAANVVCAAGGTVNQDVHAN